MKKKRAYKNNERLESPFGFEPASAFLFSADAGCSRCSNNNLLQMLVESLAEWDSAEEKYDYNALNVCARERDDDELSSTITT